MFHCSEFGKKTEDFWEEVLTEMERRYDLTNTKIYLHGDGASWIKTGLEWLPNSRFVLDRYHVNKALKSAVSGIERKSGCQYEHHLRQAGNEGKLIEFCRKFCDAIKAIGVFDTAMSIFSKQHISAIRYTFCLLLLSL